MCFYPLPPVVVLQSPPTCRCASKERLVDIPGSRSLVWWVAVEAARSLFRNRSTRIDSSCSRSFGGRLDTRGKTCYSRRLWMSGAAWGVFVHCMGVSPATLLPRPRGSQSLGSGKAQGQCACCSLCPVGCVAWLAAGMCRRWPPWSQRLHVRIPACPSGPFDPVAGSCMRFQEGHSQQHLCASRFSGEQACNSQ